MRFPRWTPLLGTGAVLAWCVTLQAAEPVPPSTAYTRTLLRATNAAAARTILGVSNGGATNGIQMLSGFGTNTTLVNPVFYDTDLTHFIEVSLQGVLVGGSNGADAVLRADANNLYLEAETSSDKIVARIGQFAGNGGGMSNAVDLIAGANVTITPGANLRSFTIASTGGGALGNVVTNGADPLNPNFNWMIGANNSVAPGDSSSIMFGDNNTNLNTTSFGLVTIGHYNLLTATDPTYATAVGSYNVLGDDSTFAFGFGLSNNVQNSVDIGVGDNTKFSVRDSFTIARTPLVDSNGFSADSVHNFFPPTNSATDGYAIVAAGTGGHTKYAAVAGGSNSFPLTSTTVLFTNPVESQAVSLIKNWNTSTIYNALGFNFGSTLNEFYMDTNGMAFNTHGGTDFRFDQGVKIQGGIIVGAGSSVTISNLATPTLPQDPYLTPVFWGSVLSQDPNKLVRSSLFQFSIPTAYRQETNTSVVVLDGSPENFLSTNQSCTLTASGTATEGQRFRLVLTNYAATNIIVTLPWTVYSEAQRLAVSTLTIEPASQLTADFERRGAGYTLLAWGWNNANLVNYSTNAALGALSTNNAVALTNIPATNIVVTSGLLAASGNQTNYTVPLLPGPSGNLLQIYTANTNVFIRFSGTNVADAQRTVWLRGLTNTVTVTVGFDSGYVITNANFNAYLTNATAKFLNFYNLDTTGTNVIVSDGGRSGRY